MWMLEYLEPWPDAPRPGDVCEPTTFWASHEDMDLPAEVCTVTEAFVETVTSDGTSERIAHLGRGFTTVLSGNADITGHLTLRGCLVWDRYLWTDYHTRPKGRLRVLDRAGHLVQHENLKTTKHAGVLAVSSDGPLKFLPGNQVEPGFGVRWNALSVELV
jgi:hypothetical protein